MSKVGKKPIDISGVEIQVNGQKVAYKGSNSLGEHELPYFLQAKLDGNFLNLVLKENLSDKQKREFARFWGLHRALLANKISGAKKDFEKKVIIVGLGYKVQASGQNLTFSLGYSHKIDVEMPKEIKLEVDKTGQNLLFKSAQKDLLGQFCDHIRSLRRVEPYKGTGVRFAEDIVVRKAGKTKS